MKVIRCSSLARPMVCPGYVFFKDLPEDHGGEAAEMGTAAGEYLERLLMKQPIGQAATNGVYFDDDMKFYTTPIYEDVMRRASGQVLCEQRIDWQTRSGIWVRGQYDISFVDDNGRLCVEDLKYGFGIVEVFENWQLLGYAIGEVIRRGEAFSEISLKIHQPRAHHEDGDTREWVITYSELLEYKEKIEKRMEEIVNGVSTLQTSENCKYCEAAPEACPAFNRLFYRALEVSTPFTQDSITNEELSRQLDQITRAEEVLKIKKDSITQLGSMRIKEGQIIPGYVQELSYTNRTWKKGVTPESIEMMTGKKPIEEKLMTPSKIEKMGIRKDFINQLTERKVRGVKLKKGDANALGDKIFGTESPLGGN